MQRYCLCFFAEGAEGMLMMSRCGHGSKEEDQESPTYRFSGCWVNWMLRLALLTVKQGSGFASVISKIHLLCSLLRENLEC